MFLFCVLSQILSAHKVFEFTIEWTLTFKLSHRRYKTYLQKYQIFPKSRFTSTKIICSLNVFFVLTWSTYKHKTHHATQCCSHLWGPKEGGQGKGCGDNWTRIKLSRGPDSRGDGEGINLFLKPVCDIWSEMAPSMLNGLAIQRTQDTARPARGGESKSS